MNKGLGIALIVAGVALLALPLVYICAPVLADFFGYRTIGLAADFRATRSLLLLAILGSVLSTNGGWLLARRRPA